MLNLIWEDASSEYLNQIDIYACEFLRNHIYYIYIWYGLISNITWLRINRSYFYATDNCKFLR